MNQVYYEEITLDHSGQSKTPFRAMAGRPAGLQNQTARANRSGPEGENVPRHFAVARGIYRVHADKRGGRKRLSACGFLLIEDTPMFVGTLMTPSRWTAEGEKHDWLIADDDPLLDAPHARAEDEDEDEEEDEEG